MTDQMKGLLITTLGALCVVPDALFLRLIGADALVMAFWRAFSVGMAIALGLVLWRGLAPFRAVLGAGWPALIYMAATGSAGVLFVLAVTMTSVANVVFILAAMPVFAAIYSRIFLGEPISRRMAATMAAVFVGLAIITWGSAETEGASRAGDAVALLVAATFAAGLTAARRARAVSMVPGVAMAYLAAALMLAFWINPLDIAPERAPYVAMHGAFIAVSAIGLALGPRFITSAEVALLILLESVLAPLLVWAVIGENPGIHALSGGAVVIGALGLSNWLALRHSRRKLPTVIRS